MTHDHSTMHDGGAATGRDISDLLPVSDDDLARLHAGLTTEAQERALLDIAYGIIDTPIGRLLLATTERGLVRVAFDREGFDSVLQTLAAKVGPRVLEVPTRVEAAAAELDEYFAGGRHTFDLPLDLTLSSGFRRAVQEYLPHIAYGHTRTYRDVAQTIGSPRAVRAVGSACATNPLPIVLPCHRVLRTDGSLGGYLGGLEAKSTLLDLERAA